MNLELLTFLLAPAVALLTLATSKPRLFLAISRHVFWTLALLNTANFFWYHGLRQAHIALGAFIRPDVIEGAALAISGLELPFAFHLGLMGNVLGYGLAHLLVSNGEKDKGDIKHD